MFRCRYFCLLKDLWKGHLGFQNWFYVDLGFFLNFVYFSYNLLVAQKLFGSFFVDFCKKLNSFSSQHLVTLARISIEIRTHTHCQNLTHVIYSICFAKSFLFWLRQKDKIFLIAQIIVLKTTKVFFHNKNHLNRWHKCELTLLFESKLQKYVYCGCRKDICIQV